LAAGSPERAAPAASDDPVGGSPGPVKPRRRPRPTPRKAPRIIDVGTPEYATVWQPPAGGHWEPRPGLLTSVVRAGGVIAYPPPLFEATVRRPELPVRVADTPAAALATEPAAAPAPTPRPAGDGASQAYSEVRVLVGALVEVLAGRRSAEQVAAFLDASVREALRGRDRVRFGAAAGLRRVRLSAVDGAADGGIEAMALVQDGPRLRAVALRFDRARPDGGRPDRREPGWLCTALQAA
jgi:hypothetical protein